MQACTLSHILHAMHLRPLPSHTSALLFLPGCGTLPAVAAVQNGDGKNHGKYGKDHGLSLSAASRAEELQDRASCGVSGSEEPFWHGVAESACSSKSSQHHKVCIFRGVNLKRKSPGWPMRLSATSAGATWAKEGHTAVQNSEACPSQWTSTVHCALSFLDFSCQTSPLSPVIPQTDVKAKNVIKILDIATISIISIISKLQAV